MSVRKSTRVLTWCVAGAIVLGVGAGAGWAANTLMSPPQDVLSSETATYTTVAEGEVGSSISLIAVSEWTSVPVGTNRASGVVTGIAAKAGDEVSTGTELYSVNLRPVVIAQGDTPAFRAISAGAEGPDVAQLQQMLASLGFYGGEIDGKAETYTVAAIRAWQKSRDLEQTGSIGVEDVIFVPTLPARVSLDPKSIARGSMLSGGEPAVQILSQAPTFSLSVTDTQARQMPSGTPVEIQSSDDQTWNAVTDEQITDETKGATTVSLISTDDRSICGDQCALIPVDGQTKLPVKVITSKSVTGLVVPSAALLSVADGKIVVVDEKGRQQPVTVVTSARGMSVIEGVDAGMRVKIPAEATK